MKTVRYELAPTVKWIERYKKCLMCSEAVRFQIASSQQFEEFENDVIKFPCPKCGCPMGNKEGKTTGQFFMKVPIG